MMNQKSRDTLYRKLFLFSFLRGVASGIWVFLPIFLLDIGGSVFDVGILAMVPGLASTFMQLAWGRVSDRLGPCWRLISIGFLFTSLLSIPVIMSIKPWQVIITTGVQVLSGSTIGVVITVRLAEILEPKRRARFMGIYNPVGFAGNIVGSLLAGLLIPLIGYRSTFLSYTTINLLIVALIRYGLRNPDEKEFRYFSLLRSSFSELVRGLRDIPALMKRGGAYTRWCLGMSTRGFGIAIFSPALVFYLVQVLKVSKPQIGLLNSITFVVLLLISPLLGWMVDKKGMKRIMLIGISTAAIYPIIFVLASDVTFLIPIYILSGLYYAFIHSAWFAWQIELIPSRRGFYAGFFSFINGLAFALGSLFGGYLCNIAGTRISALVSSAVILIGFSILITVPEHVHKK